MLHTIIMAACIAYIVRVIVKATIDPITDDEREWLARSAQAYIERTTTNKGARAMMFMNEWEIEQAAERFRGHPILGPATQTLRNLMECANRNSDGWCYWPKPCRAAKQLQELIQGPHGYPRFGDRDDVTATQVKAAYRPIKAFLTRQGLTCEIVTPNQEVMK